MRRRLLLILAAAVVLVLGTSFAWLLTRQPPAGTLETNVTDVTVVTPTTPPETTPPPPPPKPPATEPVDRRCWKMFGGGPRRTLARPGVDLGVPADRVVLMLAQALSSPVPLRVAASLGEPPPTL